MCKHRIRRCAGMVVFALVVMLAGTAQLHAQGGCVDSPEAPTDVLMLVGSIGMMYGSSVVMRQLRKRRKHL